MTASDPLLMRFATEHSVNLSNLPDPECDEIKWILRCTDALDADYARFSQQVLLSDPAVGVLWHLLSRCAEMVEGAIVAFVTASGSATEVLSRAAIERALSVGFIVLEPRSRLAAYFRHYVDEVDRQIDRWQDAAMSLPDEERGIHAAACDRRALANRQMRAFADRLENELIGSNPRERWPNIADRFKEFGDGLSYRTIYARLCSETHMDAEETLRYVVGKVHGEVLMTRMALETIGFTRLMLAIAVAYYLRAIGAYATRYDMLETTRKCRDGVARMDRVIEEFSEHVGGIPTAG